MTNDKITIIHFNDVYNLTNGAARFATALQAYTHTNPLVLFCGDVVSPSRCKYTHILVLLDNGCGT